MWAASRGFWGICWNNAIAEPLFGSTRVEQLRDMRFATPRQAKTK
jgi:hypothetical protein